MITSKRISLLVALALAAAILISVANLALSGKSNHTTATGTSMEYETKLFNTDQVGTVNISVDADEWENMLENAANEEYIAADITVNGTTFYDVGIRCKGNTSLTQVANSDSDRYSFKLEFDHYIDGQTCFGLDKLALNNIIQDATYMKEYLSYDLLGYIGVDTPLTSYVNITVNGETWGLYLAAECLEESFAERNYGDSYGQLYKVETVGNGNQQGGGNGDKQIERNQQAANAAGDQTADNGGAQASGAAENQTADDNNTQTADIGGNQMAGMPESSSGGADLQYLGDDTDLYSDIFDGAVFDAGQSDEAKVVEALKHLDSGEDLEDYINVDEVLRYFAANTALVNLDSYVSSLKHNYYLYESDGALSILPWDYNLSFAGFQSGDASSAVNFPIDTPVSGVELSERPLLSKLLENDQYKTRYHQYLDEIVSGYFENGRFAAKVAKINELISSHVENDPTAFYTYDEYEQAVAALTQFGELRAESVRGQLEGTIPSTEEGQTADSSALIDASSLSLSAMGSQGGGNMPQGGGPNQGEGFPGGTGQPENGTDQDTGTAAETGTTGASAGPESQGTPRNGQQNIDEAAVTPSGMDDEQSARGGATGDQMGGGNFPGGQQNGQGGPGTQGQADQNGATQLLSTANLMFAGVIIAAAAGALVFVLLFRRRRYRS